MKKECIFGRYLNSISMDRCYVLEVNDLQLGVKLRKEC